MPEAADVSLPVQTHAVKLDMPLPLPNQPPPTEIPEILNLDIDFDDSIFYNGNKVSLDDLPGYFQQEAVKIPQPEIHLRPEKRSHYDTTAKVLAAALEGHKPGQTVQVEVRSQVELDQARNSILNSFLFQYDTKRKVLNEQARFAYYGYPADYLETYEAGIKKVTLADLDRVARKYIHPDKLAVLVVGNGAEIKPGLEELKLGPIQSVDITIPKPPQPASDQNKQ